MRDFIVCSQWINFVLTLVLAGIVFKNMRKRMHYHLFVNNMFSLLYSISALMMLYVEGEEACFIVFLLSWAGKIGVVVSVFFFCIELSECKIPKVITVIESGFAIITYGVITTTRETGYFIKNFRVVKEKGMTILEFESGLWRNLWNVTIVAVILTCMIAMAIAFTRNKIAKKRKQYIAIFVSLGIEIFIGLLTGLPIGRYYDFNQLGFTLCVVIILVAIFRDDLMDTEAMAKEYVIDELSAGVIAMDISGAVAYYNKKAFQIFPEIATDQGKVIVQIEDSIQSGEPIAVDERVYNFEERQLVHKSLGESKMYVMIDATKHYQHIKEVEREKQIADAANRAKSEFLANMSHEIRTPINAVLGMDEMILRECKENTIREYALDIRAAGRTLLTIINDILDLNKIESGKMEILPVEYDMSSMIYDISTMIRIRAEDKHLKFHVCVSEDIPTRLMGDDVRIRQILMNLLSNAVKYTSSGDIWFRISLEQKEEAQDKADAILHFEVEDTGNGIKPEDKGKLFAKFERIEVERNRNIEGTGLGMPIAVRLLSLMGTELKIESEYGKGSVFSFDLRQKIVQETPIGNYEERMKNLMSKKENYIETLVAPDAHVLVVDDNKINLKVFRGLLKNTQIKITEVESGERAVKIAALRRFDMIFMDHMMPGMDGVEAMQKIKADKDGPCANVPIIVLTANAIEGAKEQYLEDGFDGFLSKPIIKEELLDLLKTTLLKGKEGNLTLSDI